MKKCSKCGKELPETKEYFTTSNSCKGGISGTCKNCTSEYNKQYRKNNPDKVTELVKRWHKNNPDKLAKNFKRWQKTHPDKTSEISRLWRIENPEYGKKYRDDHKDKAIEYQSRWRISNKEKFAELVSKWQKNNKEKRKTYSERYRTKKLKLPATLTQNQWESITHDFGYSCAYCGKEKPLVQEHFIALSKGGEYTHNNIIPACKNCNSSKGAKDFLEWFRGFKHYDKKREENILNYLNYDKNGYQQLALL